MKFGLVCAILVSLCLFSSAYAQQQTQEMPPASTPQAQAQSDAGAQMCSAEHMTMMLKNSADKECVATGALRDPETREIILNKIVQDPQLRREMMEKMHAEMRRRMMDQSGQGSMMEPGGMMPRGGQGGMMQQGEGGMMQQGQTSPMQGESAGAAVEGDGTNQSKGGAVGEGDMSNPEGAAQ